MDKSTLTQAGPSLETQKGIGSWKTGTPFHLWLRLFLPYGLLRVSGKSGRKKTPCSSNEPHGVFYLPSMFQAKPAICSSNAALV